MAMKQEIIKGEFEKKVVTSAKIANVLAPDFVAPDGGWGWMIVVAAGFSNFCILPILQSFGLIFRDRFEQLGINASQTTTILNVNCAVTSCIGLSNGPLFRKYSYRQASFVGGFLCAVSICALSFTRSFSGVLIFLSILYAAGSGIAMSSCALALNTYFKKRRRIATGLSWTCTGLGPIIMPQIITVLMPFYGVAGTVLLFGGFAFNSIACALLLQPVSMHAKKETEYEEIKAVSRAENIKEKVKEANNTLTNGSVKATSVESILRLDKIANLVGDRSSQRFGSQYLYYDDEHDGATGIDVIDVGTPMMSRANDGWFSKKNSSYASLGSNVTSKKEFPQQPTSRRTSFSLSRQSSLKALNSENSARNLCRQGSDADGWKRRSSVNAASQLIIVKETCENAENDHNSKDGNVDCAEINEKIGTTDSLLEKDASVAEKKIEEIKSYEKPWYGRALSAVVVFFDLDLLHDPIYVNLMMGINFANFAEMNFSLLTPFVLADYGLRKVDIAMIMSVLGGVDVVTRITIPFIATRIGWENRTFFLIGVGAIAAGRVVMAHSGSYSVLMAVSVLIGAGKALRTIFMALVIPTHVPLERLPAATGLQLVTSGIIYLILGPVVGWIRDTSGNYTIMLHCLNFFTYLTIVTWTLEVWYCNRKRQRLEEKKVAPI